MESINIDHVSAPQLANKITKPSPITFDDAESVLQQYSDKLMQKPDVFGFGVTKGTTGTFVIEIAIREGADLKGFTPYLEYNGIIVPTTIIWFEKAFEPYADNK